MTIRKLVLIAAMSVVVASLALASGGTEGAQAGQMVKLTYFAASTRTRR